LYEPYEYVAEPFVQTTSISIRNYEINIHDGRVLTTNQRVSVWSCRSTRRFYFLNSIWKRLAWTPDNRRCRPRSRYPTRTSRPVSATASFWYFTCRRTSRTPMNTDGNGQNRDVPRSRRSNNEPKNVLRHTTRRTFVGTLCPRRADGGTARQVTTNNRDHMEPGINPRPRRLENEWFPVNISCLIFGYHCKRSRDKRRTPVAIPPRLPKNRMFELCKIFVRSTCNNYTNVYTICVICILLNFTPSWKRSFN